MRKILRFLIITTVLPLIVLSLVPVSHAQESGYIESAEADFKNTIIDTRVVKNAPLMLYVPAPYKTTSQNQESYGYPGSANYNAKSDTEITIGSIFLKGAAPQLNIPSAPSNVTPQKCSFALEYSLDLLENLNRSNAGTGEIYQGTSSTSNFINPKSSAAYAALAWFYIPSGQKVEITPGLGIFNTDEAKRENAQKDLAYIDLTDPTSSSYLNLSSQPDTSPGKKIEDLFSTSTTLQCNSGKFTAIKLNEVFSAVGCQLTSFVNSTDLFGNPVKGINTPIGCLPGGVSGLVTVAIRTIVGIAGGLAIIFIIISSFNIMFNGNDPGKIKESYGNITKAVTGLFIIIFGILILSIVGIKILDLPSLGAATLPIIFGSK